MADDDDTIYIDVAAKVDERSFDEAEHKLRDKLSHAGDSLKDSLSGAFDSIGEHVKGMGGSIRDVLGESLKDGIGGALSGKEWTDLSHRTATAIGGGVIDAIGDMTNGVGFGKALGDHLRPAIDSISGDLDKLFGKLDGVSKAGGALGNVLGGNGSGQDVNDILGGAKDLGFGIPGPISQIQNVSKTIDELNKHPGHLEDQASHIPGIGTVENILEDGPKDLGNWFHDQLFSPPTGEKHDAASDKWSSSVASAISLEANTATISAGSVSLGGSLSFPGLTTGGFSNSPLNSGHSTSSGIAAAGGDSSSMASLYSGGGGTTIGKGHYDTGGICSGGSPGYDNMIGVLPGGKAVGLEGGEGVLNPNAMRMPGVADLVSRLNQHYDDGTTNVGGDPNNTSLAMPGTQGNSYGPKQQQQLGSGSGAGISGGGLIGAAEQAGVAAAGIAGFGGGAIAAQIAEQETNLAIQKSSQMAAALAAAPIETFGLGGGMMGAPTVNPMGGWMGKLIGGALGQQENLPNIAGATQPPKQPQEKPPNQGQGESVSPSAPAGTKDDPHYVKSADGPPTPPQGTAMSAMNMAPMMAGF